MTEISFWAAMPSRGPGEKVVGFNASGKLKLCIIQYNPPHQEPSETFLRAHEDLLPADVTVIYGSTNPRMGGKVISPNTIVRRLYMRTMSLLIGKSAARVSADPYIKAFRKFRPDVVLAEYGTMGVAVLEACQKMRIPLVVHFHGHDISKKSILSEFAGLYARLFQYASAIIAVSKEMQRKLIDMGAPEGKVYWNPCGVNVDEFRRAGPGSANIVFLSVGRFVEKKAPQLSLRSFAEVLRDVPHARLRMIGDGQLLSPCKQFVRELGIEENVTFLGAQSHDVVKGEMKNAFCFIQHSIQAADGDSEGTPVGILEAGASGLPVVATRHAGIPDVIVDEETGFLVDEGDVSGMAKCMVRLARSPRLAEKLGENAQMRISSQFSMQKSIGVLWRIIQSTTNR